MTVNGILYFVLCLSVFVYVVTPLHGQGITVTKERDLSFGIAISGLQQELIVDLEDPGTAFFRITGPRNTNVYISFVLPTHLTNTSGSGTVPIHFDETSAGWNRRSDQTPRPGFRFHPGVGTSARIHPQQNEIFVWLGGKIEIGAQQPGGNYTATTAIIIERTDL